MTIYSQSKLLVRLTVFLIPFLIASVTLASEENWLGDLTPGQYGVGFRTVEMYDHSRTLGDSRDYFGEPIEGERARPLQFCIWYPAEVTPDDVRMVYGEYAFPSPAEDEFFNYVSAMQGVELNYLFALSRANRGFVNEAMNLPVTAVRDATPVEGRFPVVIYHPSSRAGYAQNAALCEYLAGHGFVVATSHPIGFAGMNSAATPADMAAALRDREMVVGFVNDFPSADPSSMAVIGLGDGGVNALIHQMKNSEIDAVVSLMGRFTTPEQVEQIRQNPFFDARRSLVPFMHLYTETGEATDNSVLDELKFGDCYRIKLVQSRPTDFADYAVMVSLLGDTSRPAEEAFKAYGTMCDRVLTFLEAELKNDESARTALAEAVDGVEPAVTMAQEPPPTPRQFAEILTSRGADVALELCEKFRLDNPDNPVLPEANLNMAAYRLLQQGDPESALRIFEMIVRAYPNSANAHDSYGEVCMALGRYEESLKNYERALELLPTDSTINPALRAGIEGNAPERIRHLKELIAGQGESSLTGDEQ